MPSANYYRALEESKAFHVRNRVWSGKSVLHHVETIKMVIDQYKVESILDYGCGKGIQYTTRLESGALLEEYWGVQVFKYDPAITSDTRRIPGADSYESIHQRLPHNRKWDLVICTHVLGAIPLHDLRETVVPDLHRRARKVLFVAENLDPPRKDRFWSTTSDKIRGWTEEQWAGLLMPDAGGPALSLWFRGGPRGSGTEFRQWPTELPDGPDEFDPPLDIEDDGE